MGLRNGPRQGGWALPFAARPFGGGFPLLASRGCPEFCTYCPHRILAGHRSRSVRNIVDELEALCDEFGRPYIIFRDPLFTNDRERAMALCDEIRARNLDLRFECETRLDRLDDRLLATMRAAGLACDQLRRGVGVARHPQDGRPPADAGGASALGDRLVPLARASSRRRSTCSGFPEDDWNSIAATIDYAIDIGSTVAQFKLLTPYPATPLWKQLAPRIYETDWEKFDGFTPTFEHPKLKPAELRFLLGAAYIASTCGLPS